ncbi:MAG: hypothetical protein ACLU6V_07220, partial [Lancefieldella rimae]
MASFDHDTSRDTVYTNTSHDGAPANTLRDSAPTDTSYGSTPTDASEESPSLLKDLSMAQVLASSLAAVTAFALSSQIGIAGSIIGVAVGAAASGVASQIYQNILKKSAHKLRNLTSTNEAVDSQNNASQGNGFQNSGSPSNDNYDHSFATHAGAHVATPTERSRQYGRVAPDRLREQAAHTHNVKVARRVALVTALVAVVVVLVYALLVNVFTQGSGLGPQVGLTSIVSTQSSDADSTKATDASTSSSEKTSQDTSNTNSKQSDVGSTTDDSTK